jgi:hypothetical protein
MRKTSFLTYAVATLTSVAALCFPVISCTTTVHTACEGFVPNEKIVAITNDSACDIACQGRVTKGVTSQTAVFAQACDTACGPGFGLCYLPDDYLTQFIALSPDPDAGISICPGSPNEAVVVKCSNACE